MATLRLRHRSPQVLSFRSSSIANFESVPYFYYCWWQHSLIDAVHGEMLHLLQTHCKSFWASDVLLFQQSCQQSPALLVVAVHQDALSWRALLPLRNPLSWKTGTL
jgi:hypothetical protein